MNHTPTSIDPAADPGAEALGVIDALLDRYRDQAARVAGLRRRLAALGDEVKTREAMAQLGAEGRNEAERAARLRLALASDGDYRAAVEAEREAREELAVAEAEAWVLRQRARVAVALLALAVQASEAGWDAEPEDSA